MTSTDLRLGIDLSEQVAIVTGGGAGIGRAIARAVAAHGATVVIADISGPTAEETVAMITDAGGSAHSAVVDVTDSAAMTAFVDDVAATHGQIDLLYNNAGITTLSSIIDMSDEMWDDVFRVNCKGVFIGSRAVIPHMSARGRGRIINTASQAGKGAIPLQTHYCASKAAVIGFTRSLAIELKDTGIRVNCFCPGSVMTDMTIREADAIEELLGIAPEESLRAWESGIPLGRWVQPEDVAKIAVLLASEYTEYMTGQAVNITGGETLI